MLLSSTPRRRRCARLAVGLLAALATAVTPLNASAARPQPGAHYVAHLVSQRPPMGLADSVFHVSPGGTRFVRDSWLFLAMPCANVTARHVARLDVLLPSHVTSVRIKADGTFRTRFRGFLWGYDLNGRFADRRTARGRIVAWDREALGCKTLTVRFVAKLSRTAWRQIPAP